MAEITWSETIQHTLQTTTSTTYSDISGASIANTEFTAGDDYLIIVCAAKYNGSGSFSAHLKCVHGSTDFADSEDIEEQYGDFWSPYFWFTVWTAVSGEDVKLQFKTDDGAGTYETGVNHVQMLAIRLTDNFTSGTHYHYNASSTSQNLTATWSTSNNASITFTPPTSNEHWLVMSSARITMSDAGNNMESRINKDSGGDVSHYLSREGEATAIDQGVLTNCWCWDALPDSSSVTFTEQSRRDGGSAVGPRTHSKILAINLDVFEHADAGLTTGSITLGNADYGTNVRTLEFTPVTAGNIVMLGGFTYNPGGASDEWMHRTQIEESDTVTGVTTDAYDFRTTDATNQLAAVWCNTQNVAASAQTLDVDASVPNDPDGAAENRFVIAFSLELPSSGQTSTPVAIAGTWATQAASTTPGAVTQSVASIAGTWATQVPATVPGAVTVSPATVTATWATQAPVMSFVILPLAVAGTWAAQSAATVPGAVTQTPAAIAGTWAAQSATTVPGAVTVSPVAVAGTWAVQTVTMSFVVMPAAVAATWATQSSTTVPGAVSIGPTAVGGTWAASASSTVPGAVTVSVSTVVGTWAVQSATTTAGLIAIPATIAGNWAVQSAATVPGAVTASVAAIAGTWAVQSVSTTTATIITPTAVAGVWSMQTITSVPGAVTITPEAPQGSWNAGPVSVVPGAVTISPVSVSATWAAQSVVILTGTFTVVLPVSGTITSTATSSTVGATATSATVGTSATSATVSEGNTSATVGASVTAMDIDSEV